MKTRIKGRKTKRSWIILLVAVVMIVLGLALTGLAVVNLAALGWWSLLIGVIGTTIIGAAVMAIITNNPAWILIDLLMV